MKWAQVLHWSMVEFTLTKWPDLFRIEYVGALYHVISHGNRREDIFQDDEGRLI